MLIQANSLINKAMISALSIDELQSLKTLKMEMNIGTAVIGALGIAICASPFVLDARSRKKRENNFLQSLSDIASQHDAKLDEKELAINFAIGLDVEKMLLFFVRKTNGQLLAQHIDLCKISSCKVLKTSRTVKFKGGDQQVIDRLELGLISAGKHIKEIKLEFFNSNVSLQLFEEIQSIENWSKLINKMINHTNH